MKAFTTREFAFLQEVVYPKQPFRWADKRGHGVRWVWAFQTVALDKYVGPKYTFKIHDIEFYLVP